MKKQFLTLGIVALSVTPITIASSCSYHKKDGNSNENNSSANVVNSIAKKKAKFSENQDYFEKTGYDPKRPLSDYYSAKLIEDIHYSVNLISDLVGSWGENNKMKKFKSYQLKVNSLNDTSLFLSYGENFIPYAELYDFAHDDEVTRNLTIDDMGFLYKSEYDTKKIIRN